MYIRKDAHTHTHEKEEHLQHSRVGTHKSIKHTHTKDADAENGTNTLTLMCCFMENESKRF
jgi:hypothetical protein